MHRIYEDEDSKIDISAVVSEETTSLSYPLRLQPAFALREVLKEGYTLRKFRADLMAGIVVGIVALPLSMALAIASGVPPQYGLYTAIISGSLIALLGGSRTQVSGPTAAFVVVLAPIAAKYGIGGLVVSSLLAGIILAVIGLAQVGKFIQYIPYPVVTGFTTGIAVVVAVLQIKDFFGLTIVHMPEYFPERVWTLVTALPTIHGPDVFIGILTLVILLAWPYVTRKIPSPLVALTFAAVATCIVKKYNPSFSVATIGSRFSYTVGDIIHAGIPRMPPSPILPWNLPGSDGQPLGLSFELIRQLFPSAFAIAILGAIESLLSAVISDGMANTKHNSDAELFAQGIGNIVGPFFGAFAATGALARTATNVRSGGRTPIAAFIHSIFILLAMVLLSPLISYLPMASLAALLLIVAWNMSELKHFIHILKIAPRSDIVVLVTCFLLTVIFGMVIGVSVGLVLSSLLFMHWMAVTSEVRVIGKYHPTLRDPLPLNTILYEINGPLFFGAAQKAMSALKSIAATTHTIILYIGSVQVIDATGLINLESVLKMLREQGIFVIISGVTPQPARTLMRAKIKPEEDVLAICRSWSTTLRLANEYSEKQIKKTGAL